MSSAAFRFTPCHGVLLCAVLCRAPEPKPPQVVAAICDALQRSFIFRGIPEQQLVEVSVPDCPLHLPPNPNPPGKLRGGAWVATSGKQPVPGQEQLLENSHQLWQQPLGDSGCHCTWVCARVWSAQTAVHTCCQQRAGLNSTPAAYGCWCAACVPWPCPAFLALPCRLCSACFAPPSRRAPPSCCRTRSPLPRTACTTWPRARQRWSSWALQTLPASKVRQRRQGGRQGGAAQGGRCIL